MRLRTDDVLANGFSDHVLVCTNAREAHAACGEAGGEQVYERVVAWLRERDVLWSRVHVARTSCLGLCSESGTAVAIHPRSEWYSDVTPEDVPSLLTAEFGPDGTDLEAVTDVPDA